MAVIKLAVFVKTILMVKCTSISFIDSTLLRYSPIVTR